MAAGTEGTEGIGLKLLIDNRSKKVLFAEAGKDFVDFLFGLLQVPLGSIIAILSKNGMASSGFFGKIYDSWVVFDANYLEPNMNNNTPFGPMFASSSDIRTPLLKYFLPEAKPNFNSAMCVSAFPTRRGFPSLPSKHDGCVKSLVTYMVMDDLKVQPLSGITTMTLLSTFDIKGVGTLEEKNVKVDLKKALEIVKASFESDTVLTDVFMADVAIYKEYGV